MKTGQAEHFALDSGRPTPLKGIPIRISIEDGILTALSWVPWGQLPHAERVPVDTYWQAR